ncbi:MAG: radical SAM protein [Bacillota bacterium]|nr:radical SAM protein [Bacillota bacterium]
MESIVLIEPQSKEDHVYKHVRMPRLGLPILGTQLQEAGYNVKMYMGTGDSLPWPQIMQADLVGISTTTATCREAYQIAGMLRSNNIPVVIGGMHATFVPEEALQYADFIIRGEAEYSFLPLVRAIEAGETPEDIPGVSYWNDNCQVHNDPTKTPVDMDTLPIPDLSLLVNSSSMLSTPVMTSRGCPYNCTFCCVTEVFGRRYRHRSTESILEELTRYRGKNIFFCDDNFAAKPELTKELLRGMIKNNINLKRWGAQVRVDAARDDELLSLMKQSGCGIVYIGFESINPATLEGYHKQQTVEDIEEAIRRFHDYGIRIHGMFVFGADTDTVDTIRDTAKFALRSRIDSIQFMTLTPFPNTPFYDKLEAEGRILTRDWSLYDGHHTVFQPALLSPEELQFETIKAMKSFYSLKNILQNLALTGIGSVIHRAIGWGLTRHFERRNRWYENLLRHNHPGDSRPVALLYRLLRTTGKNEPEMAAAQLKVSITEEKGIAYLKLRGLADKLHVRELQKTLKGLSTEQYSQMVVNIEGLRFASDKAAAVFSKYLNKLGSRVRRLQVVTAAEKQARCLVGIGNKKRLRLQRFELLINRS